MSSITSSIWYTKKEKPTEDKTIFAKHKSFRDGCIDCFLWEKQEFTEAIRKDVIAWTYLDNLLVCEQELIRTRKALDVAKDTIRHADWFFDGDYNVDAKTMHSEIKCAIKGITALEQKDVK